MLMIHKQKTPNLSGKTGQINNLRPKDIPDKEKIIHQD